MKSNLDETDGTMQNYKSFLQHFQNFLRVQFLIDSSSTRFPFIKSIIDHCRLDGAVWNIAVPSDTHDAVTQNNSK